MKTNVNTWLQKLLIISAGFIFTPIFSQVDFSSTRFGLIAGPTYSRIQNAHNPSSARISFYGGALALIPIGSDDSVYNRFIAQYTNIKGNMSPSEEAKAILNMFELSAKGKSKIKSGSILEILSNIKKSSGLSQIKIGNNFKALD